MGAATRPGLTTVEAAVGDLGTAAPADLADRVRRPVLGPLLAAGTLGAVGGVLYALDLSTGPVLCPFRALTGLACPGCGTTRMLHHLLHGDVGVAFAHNPLTFLLVPLAAWAAFSWLTVAYGGRARPGLRVPARWGWLLVVVVVVYWVARNVPVGPLRALALPT